MDQRRIARQFGASAQHYESVAAPQQRLAGHLHAAVSARWNGISEMRVLDVGAGTGLLSRLLAGLPGVAALDAVDLSDVMLITLQKSWLAGWPALHTWVANAVDWTPRQQQRYDLVATSGAVQWFSDPSEWCVRAVRWLRPGGLFAMASFGPATLSGLRSAYSQVLGVELLAGVGYLDQAQLQNMLAHAGCTMVSGGSELLRVPHPDPKSLLASLRSMGVTGSGPGALRTPGQLRSLYGLLAMDCATQWELVWAVGQRSE